MQWVLCSLKMCYILSLFWCEKKSFVNWSLSFVLWLLEFPVAKNWIDFEVWKMCASTCNVCALWLCHTEQPEVSVLTRHWRGSTPGLLCHDGGGGHQAQMAWPKLELRPVGRNPAFVVSKHRHFVPIHMSLFWLI